MSTYRRPAIAVPPFYDADGQVVNYGARWPENSPPEGSYSVESHLERFAPLHAVADALVEHLVATFDVTVDEGKHVAGDVLHLFPDIVKAVRLTPNRSDAAPLTFVFTSFPSVAIHSGVLHDSTFPTCGCDACDEAWEPLAEDMEWQVFAVTAGRFSETWSSGWSPRIGYSMEAIDGSQGMSGAHVAKQLPAGRAAAAKQRLKRLHGGWQAWPRRS